jgi:hypothetical protein
MMVVIGHLAPGVAHPVEALADLAEYLQPHFPVAVGQIDVIPTGTPRGDVVKASGKFKS